MAAILDLSLRFIVGWADSAVNSRHVTIKALDMALKRRFDYIEVFLPAGRHSTLGQISPAAFERRASQAA